MIYFLLLVLIVLNVADIALTDRILKNGGRELNPLLAALFKRMEPIPAMLIVKIPFLLAVYFLMPQVPIVVMQVLVVGYACLMLWNVVQLQRGKTK